MNTEEMYIKWMVCEVKEGKKQEFSLAQDTWVKTADAKGFIAQAGGWDLKNNSEACIISFWDSKNSLEHFMDDLHDTIFYKNKQADTYNWIAVSHFIDNLNIEGKSDILRNAIKTNKSLCIADCYLNSEKSVHFEKVMKEIWTPGMGRAEGIPGGIFSKSSNNNLRYLLSTFLDHMENNNNHLLNLLTVYGNKSVISDDITKMEERVIKLVDSWKIIK